MRKIFRITKNNGFMNNGYENYKLTEVDKIDKLIDYNNEICYYNNSLNYSESLFREFGSFVKVKNFIEDNVSYDVFKKICIYCIDNIITYDDFVSYVKNPDSFDSNKISLYKSFVQNENNKISKRLTVTGFDIEHYQYNLKKEINRLLKEALLRNGLFDTKTFDYIRDDINYETKEMIFNIYDKPILKITNCNINEMDFREQTFGYYEYL